MVLMLIVPVVAAESDEQTVTIPMGGYESMYIGTSGSTIRYEVEVISGGYVDVYIADYFNYMSRSISILEGHEHEGVDHVEGTVKGVDGGIYLVVDNGDGVGILPVGDVRVRMSWEEKVEALELVMAIIIFVIVSLSIIGFVIKYRSAKRAKREHQAKQVPVTAPDGQVMYTYSPTYQDELYRAQNLSGDFCPSCGNLTETDRRTGRIYCPRCNTEVGWEGRI